MQHAADDQAFAGSPTLAELAGELERQASLRPTAQISLDQAAGWSALGQLGLEPPAPTSPAQLNIFGPGNAAPPRGFLDAPTLPSADLQPPATHEPGAPPEPLPANVATHSTPPPATPERRTPPIAIAAQPPSAAGRSPHRGQTYGPGPRWDQAQSFARAPATGARTTRPFSYWERAQLASGDYAWRTRRGIRHHYANAARNVREHFNSLRTAVADSEPMTELRGQLAMAGDRLEQRLAAYEAAHPLSATPATTLGSMRTWAREYLPQMGFTASQLLLEGIRMLPHAVRLARFAGREVRAERTALLSEIASTAPVVFALELASFVEKGLVRPIVEPLGRRAEYTAARISRRFEASRLGRRTIAVLDYLAPRAYHAEWAIDNAIDGTAHWLRTEAARWRYRLSRSQRSETWHNLLYSWPLPEPPQANSRTTGLEAALHRLSNTSERGLRRRYGPRAYETALQLAHNLIAQLGPSAAEYDLVTTALWRHTAIGLGEPPHYAVNLALAETYLAGGQRSYLNGARPGRQRWAQLRGWAEEQLGGSDTEVNAGQAPLPAEDTVMQRAKPTVVLAHEEQPRAAAITTVLAPLQTPPDASSAAVPASRALVIAHAFTPPPATSAAQRPGPIIALASELSLAEAQARLDEIWADDRPDITATPTEPIVAVSVADDPPSDDVSLSQTDHLPAPPADSGSMRMHDGAPSTSGGRAYKKMTLAGGYDAASRHAAGSASTSGSRSAANYAAELAMAPAPTTGAHAAPPPTPQRLWASTPSGNSWPSSVAGPPDRSRLSGELFDSAADTAIARHVRRHADPIPALHSTAAGKPEAQSGDFGSLRHFFELSLEAMVGTDPPAYITLQDLDSVDRHLQTAAKNAQDRGLMDTLQQARQDMRFCYAVAAAIKAAELDGVADITDEVAQREFIRWAAWQHRSQLGRWRDEDQATPQSNPAPPRASYPSRRRRFIPRIKPGLGVAV